jgi:peptidoglycan/xylan/chitin deacetylase (PgdA/CDA1 family)
MTSGECLAAPVPVPILLYHSIAARPARCHEAFTVTPAAFREHLDAIASSGRTPLTVGQLAKRMRGEGPVPSRPVLVTFDDGFADVRPAVEHLLGVGLAATVFLTSAWIGTNAMLTRSGVCDLAALGKGLEVGAHGITHARLDELGVLRAAAEISGSKAEIEDILQTPVETFAYPHGAYDVDVRDAVERAGFSAAAAVKNAFSHAADDPYALARITILASTGAARIEALLTGTGAPLVSRRRRVRTRGYRSLRRVARRLGRPLP